MKSYLSHLECTNCDKTHAADQLIHLCTDCDKVLYPRYDIDSLREEVDRDAVSLRSADMWRDFEVLPVLDKSNVVSLGEGLSPILGTPRLGEATEARNLVVKDDGRNPTGTFKSRGIAAAVSKA